MRSGLTTAAGPGWIAAGVTLAALLIGLVGGVLDVEGQLALLLFGVPTLALLINQRLGLFLFIMLVPYNGAVDVPRLAQNIVFFGIAAVFLMRLLLDRVVVGRFQLPLPREFVLYALLFTAATAIGMTHLSEITPAYLTRLDIMLFGTKEYVVGIYARQFTLIIMAVIIVWLIAAQRNQPDWIINTALASGVLFVLLMLALIAVRGFPLSEISSRTFFMVLGRQSNSVGSLLVVLFACALYMHELAQGQWRRLVLLGVTLVLMTGIVLSASRGAVLAMLLVFVWYIVEYRRLRTLLLGALILSAAALFAPDAIQDRMFRGFDQRGGITLDASRGYDDELTSGRAYIWSRLAPELLEHPVVGGGLHSTMWSEFARRGEYFAAHPHSLWLGLLMDTGLIGAAIVLLWYRYFWRSLRALAADSRLAPHLRGYFRGASVGFAAYLFYGIFNSHWYPGADQVFLWVAAGLAIGTRSALGPQSQPAATTPPQPALQGRIAHRLRPARGR